MLISSIMYLYPIGYFILFFTIPIVTHKIAQHLIKNEHFGVVMVINFLLFSTSIILLLILRDYHKDFIQHTCYDYPSLRYKDGNIPSECFKLDRKIFYGVGWPVTAMFWIVLENVYFILFYFARRFHKHRKKKKDSIRKM